MSSGYPSKTGGYRAKSVPDRLDARAVPGEEFAPVQAKFAAQPYEVPKYGPERTPVVAPEVRDGLEVGSQLAKQPDHLEVSVRLRLQPKTGADTVQVALDVELQQISGIVAWTALVGRLNPLGSSRLEVEAAAECINEKHRVVRPRVSDSQLRPVHLGKS